MKDKNSTKPYVKFPSRGSSNRKFSPEEDPHRLLAQETADPVADQSARLDAFNKFADDKDWDNAAVAARSISASQLAVNGVLHRFPASEGTFQLAEELAWRETDAFRRDPLTRAIDKSRQAHAANADTLKLDIHPAYTGTMVEHGEPDETLPVHEKPAV